MKEGNSISRRSFIKTAGAATATGLLSVAPSNALEKKNEILQVWSCGGLAEAFIPANKAFKKASGVNISYTGAFAGALGKSLLGNAETEVFAPRVVKLAKKLKDQGKMLWYKPLCFTRYILAVPSGNPANIESIEDLARPGVRIAMSAGASPPGGKATFGILKKAGIHEAAQKNIVFNGDCVQRTTTQLLNGKADVSIVEKRITRLPAFFGKIEEISIDEKYIPPPPVPFTIGMMKWAKTPKTAADFIDFILSPNGQKHFESAGFIPAISEEGKYLTQKYGV